MKLTAYKAPATAAIENAKEARILGASMSLSTQELAYLTDEAAEHVVSERLSDMFAHELMKEAVVTRSLAKAPFPDGFAIEYRTEIVVIPRSAWRSLMDALAYIAKREKIDADY